MRSDAPLPSFVPVPVTHSHFFFWSNRSFFFLACGWVGACVRRVCGRVIDRQCVRAGERIERKVAFPKNENPTHERVQVLALLSFSFFLSALVPSRIDFLSSTPFHRFSNTSSHTPGNFIAFLFIKKRNKKESSHRQKRKQARERKREVGRRTLSWINRKINKTHHTQDWRRSPRRVLARYATPTLTKSSWCCRQRCCCCRRRPRWCWFWLGPAGAGERWALCRASPMKQHHCACSAACLSPAPAPAPPACAPALASASFRMATWQHLPRSYLPTPLLSLLPMLYCPAEAKKPLTMLTTKRATQRAFQFLPPRLRLP